MTGSKARVVNFGGSYLRMHHIQRICQHHEQFWLIDKLPYQLFYPFSEGYNLHSSNLRMIFKFSIKFNKISYFKINIASRSDKISQEIWQIDLIPIIGIPNS